MSPKRILLFGASAALSAFLVVPLMGSSCDDNVDCQLPSGQVVKVPDSASGRLQCANLQAQEQALLNKILNQNNPSRSSSSSSGP
jgi:hypothetical protein